METNFYIFIIFSLGSILGLILYYERTKLKALEEKNKRLKDIVDQLDEGAKLIIKTDLALDRAQEELDKKITGLYTLHELGKKISSTFNIEDLFNLIKPPFVYKLGFSKTLIALKGAASESISIKTSIGYSDAEIKQIEKELNLNKEMDISQLFKKSRFLLVNRDVEKIDREDFLANLFGTESFLAVPIIVKGSPVGFILMGDISSYTKLTEGDAELLSILASQIGTAIENTMLYTELSNSHHDLERRVRERTLELDRLNEELKRLNKVKSDFVSAVSHELRTPLTSIKGYASILMTGKLGDVPPAQKERLEKIDKHSNSLTHLVNNLLDIARIESGRVQMDIREVSIKEMLDSVVDIITPQIKEKDITLKTNLKTASNNIKADPSQLERVFVNLLGNAVKFTPQKGKITISCEDKKDCVEFGVEDTGIGIPKDDLEKIFEEFYRADNALDQKVKGSGLGLSLVKKIIEAHKGRIWAESELGKGTKFSFIIPKS
jgi:signal transduction histidine kinase